MLPLVKQFVALVKEMLISLPPSSSRLRLLHLADREQRSRCLFVFVFFQCLKFTLYIHVHMYVCMFVCYIWSIDSRFSVTFYPGSIFFLFLPCCLLHIKCDENVLSSLYIVSFNSYVQDDNLVQSIEKKCNNLESSLTATQVKTDVTVVLLRD